MFNIHNRNPDKRPKDRLFSKWCVNESNNSTGNDQSLWILCPGEEGDLWEYGNWEEYGPHSKDF